MTSEADLIELAESLDSLDFTPVQRLELQNDPERALAWLRWAALQSGISKPAGLVLARFRSGETPPDPEAWRHEGKAAAPNHGKLLKACEALVRNTGHEYDDEDLTDEFARLSRNAKVGNGATLDEREMARLLDTARRMRERHEAAEPEREVYRRSINEMLRRRAREKAPRGR